MSPEIQLVLDGINELNKKSSSQGERIARIEANQETTKESLKEINTHIQSIHETDQEQTIQLRDHMRRTSLLEDMFKSFKGDARSLGSVESEAIKAKYDFKTLVFSKLLPIIMAVGMALVAILEKMEVTDLF